LQKLECDHGDISFEPYTGSAPKTKFPPNLSWVKVNQVNDRIAEGEWILDDVLRLVPGLDHFQATGGFYFFGDDPKLKAVGRTVRQKISGILHLNRRYEDEEDFEDDEEEDEFRMQDFGLGAGLMPLTFDSAVVEFKMGDKPVFDYEVSLVHTISAA
jgi:hypothetical protein